MIDKPKLTYHSGPRGHIAWVEHRLDASWVAAYRLKPEDGRAVIAEVRVVPYVEHPVDPEPGGFEESVPPGGMQSSALAKLRTDAVLRAQQDVIDWWDSQGRGDYVDTILQRFGFDPKRVRSEAVRRPHAARDADLARFAAAYVELCEGGDPAPRSELARRFHISPTHVSKRLTLARDHDLLTDTKRGKAGGTLTARARRYLGASA